MRFHEYRTLQASHKSKAVRDMPYNQFLRQMLAACAATMENDPDTYVGAQMLLNENFWRQNRRPFYNVYPGVVSCLSNTSLGFRVRDLGFALHATAICFAVGHEPDLDGRKVVSVLFNLSQETKVLPPVGSSEPATVGGPMVLMRVSSVDSEGKMFDSCLYSPEETPIDTWALGSRSKMLSLCIGIAMLARDSRYAEQILLAKDAGKTFKTIEERLAAIERAKNRGRNGMEIGKDIDASPHMRRPHFGIRWTEKGRSVPKLVPVAGSLVSRSKLYPVPTGYLDDE